MGSEPRMDTDERRGGEDGDRLEPCPTVLPMPCHFSDSCSHGAIESQNTYVEKLTVMF